MALNSSQQAFLSRVFRYMDKKASPGNGSAFVSETEDEKNKRQAAAQTGSANTPVAAENEAGRGDRTPATGSPSTAALRENRFAGAAANRPSTASDVQAGKAPAAPPPVSVETRQKVIYTGVTPPGLPAPTQQTQDRPGTGAAVAPASAPAAPPAAGTGTPRNVGAATRPLPSAAPAAVPPPELNPKPQTSTSRAAVEVVKQPRQQYYATPPLTPNTPVDTKLRPSPETRATGSTVAPGQMARPPMQAYAQKSQKPTASSPWGRVVDVIKAAMPGTSKAYSTMAMPSLERPRSNTSYAPKANLAGMLPGPAPELASNPVLVNRPATSLTGVQGVGTNELTPGDVAASPLPRARLRDTYASDAFLDKVAELLEPDLEGTRAKYANMLHFMSGVERMLGKKAGDDPYDVVLSEDTRVSTARRQRPIKTKAVKAIKSKARAIPVTPAPVR